MANFSTSNFQVQEALFLHRQNFQSTVLKFLFVFIFFFSVTSLKAQVSGAWDSYTGNGTPGNNNYGNGVIRLISDVNTGCAAGAVHETTNTYDPTLGASFNKCYQVFFGCPGNDEIGSDANGDGMAFSFWKNSATYNINNGLACGGGLGYMGSASDGKMITIEFDTYSSAFDGTYGGGPTGNNDEISVHINGDAGTSGIAAGGTLNVGNLEDGLEHTICITYTPGTNILLVTIDGVSKLSYNLGATNNLQTYFGAGGLNQTWSSGKHGATNPTTVNDGNGTTINSQLGGVPLCPAEVVITSPSNGTSFGGCPIAPINITATATPPAGNTVSFVEFFIDGVSIGTDNTATNTYNYGISYNSPTEGSHAITAEAHYIPSATISTSTAVNINVGGTLNLTTTAPTVDGTVEALWNSYSTINLNQASGGITAPDLDATYKFMYDATNLYILVDVTDDVLIRDGTGGTWEDDGVEIFIDIGNDNAPTYVGGANDYQYSFNWNNGTPVAVVENKSGATAGVTYGHANRVGGYVMEIRIPWTTLGGTPTAGTYMGFDVKLNDDDNNGTRDNELTWSDGTFGAWNNPSLMGTVQFSNCNPLPVTLLTFAGTLQNETVILNWTTSEEVNNEKFIIERFNNQSESWDPIGEVAGAGNNTSIVTYIFTDTNPLDGIVYYRLRQEDLDEKFTYSDVVAVTIKEQNIAIMPNPFDNVLTIQTKFEGEVEIKIYNILGSLLYQEIFKVENDIVQIQPYLPVGAYFITLQTDTFFEQRKIIKK